MFKKNKVDFIKGWGTIANPNSINVKKEDGSSEEFRTKNILIATGSEPSPFPGLTFDEKIMISSTGIELFIINMLWFYLKLPFFYITIYLQFSNKFILISFI